MSGPPSSLSSLVPQNFILSAGAGSALTWTNSVTLASVNYSTMAGSSITTTSLAANAVTVSTLATNAVSLTSSVISLGLSTNSSAINFSNGSYTAGSWNTASGVSLSSIKDVMVSASGQFQTISNASTSNLLYSNNSGNTWSTLSGVSGTITETALSASGQNMLVGTTSSNVFVTSNASTFTAKNLGAPFGHFQFENNLNDTQGNMTLTNFGSAVTYSAGQVGTNAVRLTNTLGAAPLQYLRAPWNAPQAFTISGWFNVATIAVSTQEDILSAYNEAIAVIVVNTTCFMRMPTGSGSSNTQYTGTISAGTWNSFTMIFQTNGLCSSYLNNIFLGSFMNSGGFGTNTNSSGIVFGTSDNLNLIYPFNGSLDDIRIFPYAVSPVGPNLYFPFENSTADVISNTAVTVTGTPTYVAGLSTGSAIRLTNTPGSAAAQFLSIPWTLPASFMLSGWFNVATLVSGTPSQTLLSMQSGGLFMYLIPSSMFLSFVFPTGSGTTQAQAITTTAISPNVWYNFMIIYQTGGLYAAYLNGALIGSGTSTGFGTFAVSNLFLGTNPANTASCNISFDDIRLYNTANLYPTATISKNYPVVAMSGNGACQLAGTTDGELFLSADSGNSWTIQPAAKILGSWQSLSLNHTGQYMAATATTTQVTPNQTNLGSSTWTQNGVTWTASASSVLSGFPAYNTFDNLVTTSWVTNLIYSSGTGTYAGSVSTMITSIGAVLGEWLQLQYSTPLVLQSYTYSTGPVNRAPRSYYIVGSNDGSTWIPLQFVTMTVNPFTVGNLITTSVQMNYTGTQTIQGNVTGLGTTTAYSFTTNAYQYFRIVVISTYLTDGYAELSEFRPIFTNGSSYSINSGVSWAPGSAQAITVPQYTQTTPNLTGLAAATWTANGVNWVASASSVYSGGSLAYLAFNNSASGIWASNSGYSSVNGTYTGAFSTIVQGITPPVVSGEWLQLQSSIPLILQSYTYGNGGQITQAPKIYYIVGSNDGSTWYPLQFVSMTTIPFTATGQLATTYLQMNYTGIQTIQAGQTGSGSTTAYSFTTNAYTYFRIITTSIYTQFTVVELGEFLPIFVIPSTTTSTSALLSNTIVSQSGSGQYAIGHDTVNPLARLTLDNTAADSLGALTAATGAGTVTYSSSIVKVGTHSAFFNNVPGSNTVTTFLNYTVPASLNKPSAITMSCWVYPTSYGLGTTASVPLSLSDNGVNGTNIYFGSTGVVFSTYATTTNTTITNQTSATTIPLNAWSHLALTFGSGVISLYVNGSCAVSTAVSGNFCAIGGGNLTNLIIGANKNGVNASNAFLGYVDDVRLYTTSLSSLQIANLYSNPAFQVVEVSSRTIAGLSSTAAATTPFLAGLNAAVVASAASFTGQFMVVVTAGTTNNVYYSVNYGATFTGLTIGSLPMVSCAISADGSYLSVANATMAFRLNSNSSGFTLAIGNQAGAINQAANAIAIGNQAGQVNQSANSIVLNASGSALNAVESGLYIAPILAASAASASSSVALLGYGSDSQVVQTGITQMSNGNMVVPGNVGIGTTNPAYGLDVRGSAFVSSITAPLDLLAQGPYLIPSSANSATIQGWLSKTVNTVAPIAGIQPFWASSNTYSTIAGAPGSYAYVGGVLLPDGRVVFVPHYATTIGLFNPATNTYSTIAGAPGSAAYSGGVLLPDGRVVFVPFNATTIGLFNPVANTYSTIAGAPGGGAYLGGVLLPDGRVVFVPHNATTIGLFNPVTNTFSTIAGAPGGAAYIGGVLLPDGRVVFVPHSATTIGLFNPATNTYSTIAGAPGSAAYSGGVLLPDGRVVFVPYNATTIGLFNPATNTYSTVAGAPGSAAYQGGVLLPDGRVVFVPFNATTIGLFNPVANTFSTIAGTPGSNAYQGGVLLPDGRVVFVPHNATTIGLLLTNTPAPKELCLHPFFNKF